MIDTITIYHVFIHLYFSLTGLDPAMPMFAGRDRDNRLDSEDAKFVDVIHTSAFVQGQYARSGHVDFYMNGGIEQPGCWNASSKYIQRIAGVHRRDPGHTTFGLPFLLC